MIQLYFKAIISKRIENKKRLSTKKTYKTYFWLLKSPRLSINSSNSNFLYRFSNKYLSNRLDIILFQTNFCSSIKQARFLIRVLQIFALNSIDYKKNLVLENNTIITIKNYFINTMINLINSNIKIRNKNNKRIAWLKKNYYFSNSNISYSYQLNDLNLNNLKVKEKYYYKQILLDSINLNFIVL